MKFPIKITRGHRWCVEGYQPIFMRGKVTCSYNGPTRKYTQDTTAVKWEVWLADYLYYLPSLPEYWWRGVLARLWYERLNFQYESGYAAGMREACSEAFQSALKGLTQEERKALFAEPSYEELKWGGK